MNVSLRAKKGSLYSISTMYIIVLGVEIQAGCAAEQMLLLILQPEWWVGSSAVLY